MNEHTQIELFETVDDYKRSAWVNSYEQYMKMYRHSIEDPEVFWSKIADTFSWTRKWEKVLEYNFDITKGPIFINWFKGARTNITTNCLDRHLDKNGNKNAIIWEGNEPGKDRCLTYSELHREVCRFANVLKDKGVEKGDRVSIYMPMVPELAIAMLACARIGAVHSIVFGGFSAEALADRIVDSSCQCVITIDGVNRGKKSVPLKQNVDKAIRICEGNHRHVVDCCIALRHIGVFVNMQDGRDFWWDDLMAKASDWCEPEEMKSDDPLFVLYTSGSTGKPKGVQHNIGGYMVYTGISFKHIFDYRDQDIFWCTADIGWVTGHSYIIYGPFSQGATTVMFEGIPNYPDPGRFWEIIDKWKVTQFYTAPTAIRALMKEGDDWVNMHDKNSLRILGSVGEPINPEVWLWYWRHVGGGRCPIVDTWWQTETGGVMITPLAYAIAQKPGSATLPYFGVLPAVLDDKGQELDGATEGILVIKQPWPGQMTTVFGDHKRFEETYFQMFPGYYFSGDGCKRDEDGYYWITGRVDDVINVSGHRMGTAEIESALVSHSRVAEAAVVGFPQDIKGQGIYAYVVLNTGIEPTDDLKKDLIVHVRTEIGPIATPDKIHFTQGLPKTRSGKIMRRILRKIAANEIDNMGDITTLADPSVVESLLDGRRKLN